MLIDEKGNLTLTKEALYEVTKARIRETAQKQAEMLINTVKGYETEEEALGYLRAEIDNTTISLTKMYAASLKNIKLNLGEEVYNELLKQFKAIDEMTNQTIAGIGQGLGGISGSETDTWLENYNKLYANLQHLRNMDKISTEEYYNRLRNCLKIKLTTRI